MFFGTFLAIFTFIPLSFVSFSAHEIYKGIQSNTWKKTNGKILSIRTISDNDSTKHSNTKVFYQYASGGKTYTNSKISYLKEFPYIGEEFDTFNLYNSSDSVSVFLNPDTKEESVLIQGTGIFPFFLLLLGVCFSNIFGFWFAIYIDSHKTLTKKISPQKQRSVFFTSFLLPFLAVASLISFLGFQNVYTHHLAENWPTTEATILRAEVQNRDDLHQNISDRTRLSQYIPKIEYSYRIENKEYIGNRIQTGGIWSSSDSSVAKEIVQKYKGRSVRIYYNPENPTESYLERSGIFRAYSIGIISGLFSVFIFLILIRIWKIKK
ncbi:PF12158 family protein [Leptospira noguchii]|uniref:PF12158 family protein n=1 Tax=Leptospira noguchii TaxID=28182 RepID=M6VG99_9LEPT|nr:PF12158 family protein [Leptospira noguchii]